MRSGPYFQWFRELGGVRVSGARIHFQLLEHRVTERPFRQHALHGHFEYAPRMTSVQLGEIGRVDTAGISAMAVIQLVARFTTGDAELIDVYDDDIIAHINVRRKLGLVLAAQTMREC